MTIVFELDRYERIRPFRVEWAWLPTIKRGWLEIQVRRVIVRLFPR
jgi:hypothetical protein